jgi:hypothetical protein
MIDLIYLAIIAAFFLLALGYIRFCASLQTEEEDEY